MSAEAKSICLPLMTLTHIFGVFNTPLILSSSNNCPKKIIINNNNAKELRVPRCTHIPIPYSSSELIREDWASMILELPSLTPTQ
jgi:hypothetical protein